MKKLVIPIIVLFYIIISACSNDDEATPEATRMTDEVYETAKTKIPTDVAKLFIAYGDPSAERVILYEEGGPNFEFFADSFEPSFIEDPNKPYFSSLFKDDYRVYVHQSLTLNGGLCSKNKLTEAQSDKENITSIEILDRVIQHFKSQGKTVFVTGHSFGGFVVTKYLAERGSTTADRFLIMGSRLDMQLIVAESYVNCTPYFFEGGITPKPYKAEDLRDLSLKDCPSVASIAGAMVSERFTQSLSSKDLSNVVFAFARDDEQSGSLLPDEIAFLKSKNASIVEIVKGGHDSMFDSKYSEKIYKELIKDN